MGLKPTIGGYLKQRFSMDRPNNGEAQKRAGTVLQCPWIIRFRAVASRTCVRIPLAKNGECYRFSANKDRSVLLFGPAACNIVEFIDSPSKDTPGPSDVSIAGLFPGPTNISITELLPHRKTPIASRPPATDQTLLSFTLCHIPWNIEC